MPADIFGLHDSEDATVTQGVEARDAAKHPAMQTTATTTKNYPLTDVNNAMLPSDL